MATTQFNKINLVNKQQTSAMIVSLTSSEFGKSLTLESRDAFV